MSKNIIAVDGHAASGKGTVCKLLAKKLGYHYVGAGTIFRTVTWLFLNNKIKDFDEVGNLIKLRKLTHVYLPENGKEVVCFNGENITTLLAGEDVARETSNLAGKKFSELAEIVRQITDRMENVIVDGRNVGTDIFPEADLKLFVTANVEVRGNRRYLELCQCNPDITLENVTQALIERDKQDSERVENPFRIAPDAVKIDTSTITPEEVIREIENILGESNIKTVDFKIKINY